ncbi:ABC transporter substrate-binding protein [Sphingobacterium sp. SYP-B4668]|uniref:ABC transporter substrate-binding protein n=1 Tax=Sphingobacterium sp. SYP-B4668 TaxID=2996035 RepID=UPI0022DE1BDB|nr:ABC transporter substrate-binding protein [Sphingobacterium sp. SYP-B4668]
MISVRNHQQRLSGNNLVSIAAALLLIVASCAPKGTQVLRAPDYNGGNVGAETKKDEGKTTVKELSPEEKKAALKKSRVNQIALVLPFQLHQMNTHALSEEDVKRSALALDFYQGFQMGLDDLAKKGTNFTLNILDSRDDATHTTALAKSDDIEYASLVVGPIYPKEIRIFGENSINKNILQVSPLAATMPTEFNISNLVSLTPPIRVHMRAVAKDVAKRYRAGDVVVIYNTEDSDGKQFLNGLQSEIMASKADIKIYSVSTIDQLNQHLTTTGSNFILTGTTSAVNLRSLLSNLEAQSNESYYAFNVYGHPNWDRFDFKAYSNVDSYNIAITSSFSLQENSSAVRNFKTNYRAAYKIEPSEFSFKGYDAAQYFGRLIAKYGKDYAKHVVNEPYDGLSNSYDFQYNAAWGYVNNAVGFMQYRNGAFQYR